MPILIQRGLATIALLLIGPLLLCLAIVVRLTSPGPVFHRAIRFRPGGTFTLYKLRTMRADAAATGPGVTAGGDPRVTTVGRFLRRTKLDELPQLWNVVRGDMALVGPRPEDPRYVDLTDPIHAQVFGAVPGITGRTTLAYRDEELILAAAATRVAMAAGRTTPTEADLDTAYRDHVLPDKLAMDASQLDRHSIAEDLRILIDTVRPSARGAHRMEPPSDRDRRRAG